jgi:hypothetical protein
MISDAVKIARSQERQKLAEVARDILTNPIIDVVVASIIIEYLRGHDEIEYVSQPGTHAQIMQVRHVPGGGWMDEAAISALQAGLVAALLTPSLVETAKGLKPFAESLAPLMLRTGS